MTFALSDCNNFYASVERVFNPKLEAKPVVVLSNNDGVIIARSNEAKALGIKMATPIFKVQDIIDRHKVHVFSSNYVLETSGVKEAGNRANHSRYDTQLSSLFDIVYQQKTRDGIGYVPDHKDAMIKGYKEGAKALGDFEAKKGQEGKAILTVEHARDAVEQIQLAAVKQVEGLIAQLNESRAKEDEVAAKIAQVTEQLTGEKDQADTNWQSQVEELSGLVLEWQSVTSKAESEASELKQQLEDLQATHNVEMQALKDEVGTEIYKASKALKVFRDDQDRIKKRKRKGVVEAFDEEVKPAMQKLTKKYPRSKKPEDNPEE